MSFDRELLAAALPAYDIGDELGQGGMGVVVSGQHRRLGRRVAIKQLAAAFAVDPAVRRRFTEEARVLAAAHRRGILHRDIKPENMLFAGSGLRARHHQWAAVTAGHRAVRHRASRYSRAWAA